MKVVLGVIGGSGVYDLPLENAREERVITPWGEPSDTLRMGRLEGTDVVFLARHGRGHVLSPSTVNYRANIDALKRAGATDVVSVSAVGSLREDATPGTFVIVEQFLDRTRGLREGSFFTSGFVAHVSMAKPTSGRLSDVLERSCKSVSGVRYKRGGTYLAMEGPQFGTKAESHLYRDWGCDVVGMTAIPEVRLAREAELPYATLAMVTDYDCWREDGEDVSAVDVLSVMKENADKARAVVRAAAADLGAEREADPEGLDTALDAAVVTAPEKRDPGLTAKLDAVAGRFLRTQER